MKSSSAALVNIDIMIKVSLSLSLVSLFLALNSSQKAMSHCVEEAERIYKSCGKAYELSDEGTYQVRNPHLQ